ncbi:MAG: pyridoxal-dependent decarboxylase, partial [Anaerolineae bacterium]|jgi:L-2,4-diaminobutyrate decarboxylase
MGLGERCLVTVDMDGDRRLDVACLEEALTSLSKTKDVFCVVATAGTTSTGSVDPLAPVARLCQDTGAWFHVDGAYGLAYSLVPEWGLLFAGVELADSVSWDPHKQFRVSIPNSVFFARRREDFRRMALFADYFNPEGEVAPNPGLKSIPSTRPLAALELVTSLRHQGLHKVRENLRAPLVAIRVLAEHIQEQADLELSHKPDTGILCFRATPPGFPEGQLDDLQSAIYERIVREGKRSISLTRLDGRAVLRLVAISPVVTAGAMIETMAVVQRLAREILMEA